MERDLHTGTHTDMCSIAFWIHSPFDLRRPSYCTVPISQSRRHPDTSSVTGISADFLLITRYTYIRQVLTAFVKANTPKYVDIFVYEYKK
jgi:hypothetical protein